ncbi:cyclic nucleotide-gated channel alpha-4 [Mergus octosetaceus]
MAPPPDGTAASHAAPSAAASPVSAGSGHGTLRALPPGTAARPVPQPGVSQKALGTRAPEPPAASPHSRAMARAGATRGGTAAPGPPDPDTKRGQTDTRVDRRTRGHTDRAAVPPQLPALPAAPSRRPPTWGQGRRAPSVSAAPGQGQQRWGNGGTGTGERERPRGAQSPAPPRARTPAAAATPGTGTGTGRPVPSARRSRTAPGRAGSPRAAAKGTGPARPAPGGPAPSRGPAPRPSRPPPPAPALTGRLRCGPRAPAAIFPPPPDAPARARPRPRPRPEHRRGRGLRLWRRGRRLAAVSRRVLIGCAETGAGAGGGARWAGRGGAGRGGGTGAVRDLPLPLPLYRHRAPGTAAGLGQPARGTAPPAAPPAPAVPAPGTGRLLPPPRRPPSRWRPRSAPSPAAAPAARRPHGPGDAHGSARVPVRGEQPPGSPGCQDPPGTARPRPGPSAAPVQDAEPQRGAVPPLGPGPGTTHRPHAGVSGAGGCPAGGDRDRGTRGIPISTPAPSAAAPQSWILDPSGDWYYWWLSAMVLPIMYNWIVIVCRSCFAELQEQHMVLWLSLDCLSDALYLLDIAVHLHTGFLEEGILVQDRAQIRRRYLRSASFPWDVASVLPTDLLYLHLGPAVPAVRANRFLRVPRLFEAFDRRETRTAHPYAFRIAKLMLYVFVTIHWNSCLYFALSTYLGLGADDWVYPNASRPGFARPLRQYLHSFYISTLILTTVGDTPEPQREEEFLFMTAGFLLAVLGFATIMGSMSSVIANMNAADAAFYPDHGPVQQYLQAHGVGGRLVRRVAGWHQHLRAHRKLVGERAVLRHLPSRLRAEVAASVHLPALRKVSLFQSCERGVLEALVLKLRPQVFSPGEFVCRTGDVGREMYFIREGHLAVVAADGITRLAILGEGLYFGEISLINIRGNRSGNRRTANIQSIGYSDLFCLSKEDLTEVLAEFPSARTLMEAKGREILLRMDKLDVHSEAAAAAAAEEAEQQVQALEVALEELQTRVARLLAQLESSAFKLALRIGRLESRAQQRRLARERAPARDQGPTRLQEPDGAQGPTRVQGPVGLRGPTGVQYPMRAQGPTRVQGPTDVQGPTRVQVSTRVQGPTGVRGPTGVQGTTRVQGSMGMQGPTGVRGPAGVQGPTRGKGPTGVWGTRRRGPRR